MACEQADLLVAMNIRKPVSDAHLSLLQWQLWSGFLSILPRFTSNSGGQPIGMVLVVREMALLMSACAAMRWLGARGW